MSGSREQGSAQTGNRDDKGAKLRILIKGQANLSLEDQQDLCEFEDLLVRKGIFEKRHLERCTPQKLQDPPGEALPADRIEILVRAFNPAAMKAGPFGAPEVNGIDIFVKKFKVLPVSRIPPPPKHMPVAPGKTSPEKKPTGPDIFQFLTTPVCLVPISKQAFNELRDTAGFIQADVHFTRASVFITSGAIPGPIAEDDALFYATEIFGRYLPQINEALAGSDMFLGYTHKGNKTQKFITDPSGTTRQKDRPDITCYASGSSLCVVEVKGTDLFTAGETQLKRYIGLSSALVPLYISEISPGKIRGTLGSLNQLVICIGILSALLTNIVVPALEWRAMFYSATVPATLLGIGMSISPESPRWQYSKGEAVAAKAGATKLWGSQGPASLDEGRASKPGDLNQSEKVTLQQLLQCKGALIGVLLFVAQQLSGINAVVYFSSATFMEAGVKSGTVASAVVGTINVLGTILAASLIERFGRKQLLSLSFSGMGVSMLAMAAGFGVASLAGLKGNISLLGTVAYVAFFSLGAGAVPGLLVPEITPAQLRGKAVSLALAAHWVCNFGIGQLFLPAVAKFGLASVYLFFAAVCATTVWYTRSQVVETKGLSLEEIERLLEK